MEKVANAAQQVQVREVALIDGGSGETLPNYVSAFPGIVGGLFREMRDSVGIDIGGVLTGDRELNRTNNDSPEGGGGDGQKDSGGSDGGAGGAGKPKGLSGKSRDRDDLASQKTIRSSFLKRNRDDKGSSDDA